MSQIETNKEILKKLNEFFTNNPNVKFLEGLISLKVIPSNSSMLKEESSQTLTNIDHALGTIVFTSRYGDKYTLTPVNRHLYYFDFGKDSNHIRLGIREGFEMVDNEFYFIDPPGGPFISIGDEVDNKIVVRIFFKDNKYYLYLSDKQ